MPQIYKYGLQFDMPPTELENELQAFKHNPPEGLGKAEHFWNIAGILWPEKIGNKNNPSPLIRNPWSEKMITEASRRHSLAVLGGLNSSKSETFAAWAIVNWLANPWETIALLTSTTLGDSKRRMWSSVKRLFQANPGLPGKLIDSKLTIKTDDGSGRSDDKCGISLLAGEKDKEKESVGKLIGIKQKNIIFIADELPELTPALVEAYFSNLAPSNENAQMVGIGNFKSIFDSLGTFCTPKQGWGSVCPDDEEWECERGVFCIRFDGLKSPNLILGEDKYPFLYSSKSLARHRETYGEDSAFFWRMCRSFPCPEGDDHVLYSESDFMKGESSSQVIWMEPPVPVIAADPDFSSEGDGFSEVRGLFGRSNNGLQTLCITGYSYIRESMALVKAGEPRDIQTARLFSEKAREHSTSPENAAIDASGPGGLAYASILSAVWSARFLPVKFGESPSDRLVSEDDPKTCAEAFANRVTELWAIGKAFVRAGQIKGLPQEIAKQLKSRMYETVKGVTMKMKVESKRDMKARVGFSPNHADAFLILVELCRERFGFTPGSVNGMPKLPQRNDDWIAKANDAHSLYEPNLAFTDAHA